MKEPKPVQPGEPLIPCPNCRGIQPKRSVRFLRNYVQRKLIEGAIDGEELQCAECGATFCLCYRTGIFGKAVPYQHVATPHTHGFYPGDSPPEVKPPDGPPPVRHLTPRERKAQV